MLTVSRVPAGTTATFGAPTMTAGQSTFLNVVTNRTTPQGSYPLTVTATGLVNGVQTTRSASITLQVQAAGVTSLTGQVLDEDAHPVEGALVRLGGLQATTDDAGNFLIVNPPPGADELLLIDGGPASTPGKSFPIIPYKVTIVAGQANTLGFTPHLHFQKTTGLVDISNSSLQRVVTDPSTPGFQMALPAGVTVTGWDGQANAQVSIRQVPADRAPLPPFPADRYSPTLYMYAFGKQGGGTPSAPVPLTFPNDLGVPPGTPVELWFYDEAPDGSRPNQWAQYGTGTVSADGSQIVPDLDPSTGKPYGQPAKADKPRFCGGGSRGALLLAMRTALNALRGGEPLAAAGTGQQGGEPVDLGTGIFTLAKTDLVLPGRLPIVFTRTYRTKGPTAGPFGPGTSHLYQVFLLVEGDLRTLVLPTGGRAAFPRQPDGTFRNGTDPAHRGAVLTQTASGHSLRFKDGATWTFGPGIVATVDDRGRATAVAFLSAQTDRTGNTLTLTRTPPFAQNNGQNVTAITEPSGRQLTLTYDANFRITSITDPLGRTVQYTYSAAGLLETVADPAGGVTRYTYDAQNRMLTITDPRGSRSSPTPTTPMAAWCSRPRPTAASGSSPTPEPPGWSRRLPLPTLAENLALRQQLAVLKHRNPRPKRRRRDRIFWVWLSRLWTEWRSVLLIVRPETVVRWHGQGFRLYWRWKSQAGPVGRPQVEREIRELIRRRVRENPLWGAPRIQAELRLLGYRVADSTVAKYMPRGGTPPSPTWWAFLANHVG